MLQRSNAGSVEPRPLGPAVPRGFSIATHHRGVTGLGPHVLLTSLLGQPVQELAGLVVGAAYGATTGMLLVWVSRRHGVGQACGIVLARGFGAVTILHDREPGEGAGALEGGPPSSA